MKTALKVLISLWIVYHIVTMVVLANGSSYLGRHLGGVLVPYANALGMNATWNFFSPDPAHTMFFRYKVLFEDQDGNEIKESEEGYLPPEKGNVVMDSSKRRLLYAMRFLLLDSSRMRQLMAPWLCRQHPGASRVSIHYILQNLPSLDVARLHAETPIEELKQETQSSSAEFNCSEFAAGEDAGESP